MVNKTIKLCTERSKIEINIETPHEITIKVKNLQVMWVIQNITCLFGIIKYIDKKHKPTQTSKESQMFEEF